MNITPLILADRRKYPEYRGNFYSSYVTSTTEVDYPVTAINQTDSSSEIPTVNCINTKCKVLKCDLKFQVNIPGECCAQCINEVYKNKPTIENHDINKDYFSNEIELEETVVEDTKTCYFNNKIYQVSPNCKMLYILIDIS